MAICKWRIPRNVPGESLLRHESLQAGRNSGRAPRAFSCFFSYFVLPFFEFLEIFFGTFLVPKTGYGEMGCELASPISPRPILGTKIVPTFFPSLVPNFRKKQISGTDPLPHFAPAGSGLPERPSKGVTSAPRKPRVPAPQPAAAAPLRWRAWRGLDPGLSSCQAARGDGCQAPRLGGTPAHSQDCFATAWKRGRKSASGALGNASWPAGRPVDRTSRRPEQMAVGT